MILKLGEAGLVQIEISSQVLAEIESVVRRKLPNSLADLAVLLDRAQVHILSGPGSDSLLAACLALTHYPGDARVLVDAWQADLDFMVTLDKEHFLSNDALRAAVPFVLGTPGDFLAWMRERVGG